MTIWNSLFGWFTTFTSDDSSFSDVGSNVFDDHHCDINPASGLPMVGGCGGVDIEGNPYGTDFSHDHDWLVGHTLDDSLSGSLTSWDNGIDSGWSDWGGDSFND